MKYIVILLMILLGIFTWNSSSFEETANNYQTFAAVVFVLDIIGGVFILIFGITFDND